MNFVAHMVVAQLVADRPTSALLLGAAAPDLTRMARVPLATAGTPGHRAGVALHHRTDAVFHELAWFRDQNRRLVQALGDRGVRRGPARGAAHVLIELLLDGALLARDEHAETLGRPWRAMAGPDGDALAMVDTAHRHAWRGFLGQLTTRLVPSAYGDPAYATDRTANTLARRPRLALSDDETVVLRHLAVEAQVGIAGDAEEVVGATARSVAGHSGSRADPGAAVT